MKLSFRHPAYYKWGVTEVPAEWTAAQWESVQEVCTSQGVKLSTVRVDAALRRLPNEHQAD